MRPARHGARAVHPALRRDTDDEPDRLHSEIFKGSREGGLGLLRELHDLYLMAAECEISWTLVGQAAKGARDDELDDAVGRCEDETATQMKWLRARMKQAAPKRSWSPEHAAAVRPEPCALELATGTPTSLIVTARVTVIGTATAAGELCRWVDARPPATRGETMASNTGWEGDELAQFFRRAQNSSRHGAEARVAARREALAARHFVSDE